MSGTRKGDWDFLKFVLMFLIVFGHVCPTPTDTWNAPTRLVGLFAIPLFFFVSGYFQTSLHNGRDFLQKLWKTVKRIVVPQASWGFLYVVLLVVTMYSMPDWGDSQAVSSFFRDLLSFLKYSPIYVAGIFWFLTALLLCVVMGSLLSLLIAFHRTMGLLVTAGSSVALILLPFELYHVSFIWFFYAMGMVYRYLEPALPSVNKNRKTLLFFFLASIVVLYINTRFFPDKSFYGASNLLAHSSVLFIFKRFALYSLATMTAFYWIKLFYMRFENNKMVRVLSSWGKDTLFIYCSHVVLLVFLYFPVKQSFLPESDSVLAVFLVSTVSLLASAILYMVLQYVCKLLKKSVWMRALLMGL